MIRELNSVGLIGNLVLPDHWILLVGHQTRTGAGKVELQSLLAGIGSMPDTAGHQSRVHRWKVGNCSTKQSEYLNSLSNNISFKSVAELVHLLAYEGFFRLRSLWALLKSHSI